MDFTRESELISFNQRQCITYIEHCANRMVTSRIWRQTREKIDSHIVTWKISVRWDPYFETLTLRTNSGSLKEIHAPLPSQSHLHSSTPKAPPNPLWRQCIVLGEFEIGSYSEKLRVRNTLLTLKVRRGSMYDIYAQFLQSFTRFWIQIYKDWEFEILCSIIHHLFDWSEALQNSMCHH